jgi:pullulanase/glycogen debranching enzyme
MSNNRSTWLDWDILVKRTVARFARGNIAAQQGRILFPEEQARQRERVRDVTRKWKERALRALS